MPTGMTATNPAFSPFGVLRRLAVIRVAQRVGLSLSEIRGIVSMAFAMTKVFDVHRMASSFFCPGQA